MITSHLSQLSPALETLPLQEWNLALQECLLQNWGLLCPRTSAAFKVEKERKVFPSCCIAVCLFYFILFIYIFVFCFFPSVVPGRWILIWGGCGWAESYVLQWHNQNWRRENGTIPSIGQTSFSRIFKSSEASQRSASIDENRVLYWIYLLIAFCVLK